MNMLNDLIERVSQPGPFSLFICTLDDFDSHIDTLTKLKEYTDTQDSIKIKQLIISNGYFLVGENSERDPSEQTDS